MSILEVKGLKKLYIARNGENKVTALENVSFSVDEGEFTAIMGESGSGKTTLLNILATLDKPTDGTVLINGRAITRLSDKEKADFRRERLGFIFQEFNLLDTFSLRDNILLPLVLKNTPYDEMTKRLTPIAALLGIEELLDKYPYEVSGGQKQRAAAARALITGPELILGDEPTGALDSGSSEELLRLLSDVNKNGQTILMVTHSVMAASKTKCVLFIKDGSIMHQLYKGDDSAEDFYRRISDTLTVHNASRRAGKEDR